MGGQRADRRLNLPSQLTVVGTADRGEMSLVGGVGVLHL